MSPKLRKKFYHGNKQEALSDVFRKVTKHAAKLLSESWEKVLNLKEVSYHVGGNERMSFWFWFCEFIVLVENFTIYN